MLECPAKMIGKTLLALLVSLLLLCLGIGVVVLVYLWLVWYASLHGFSERPSEKNGKQGLSEADIQKLPTVESGAFAAEAECAVCLDFFESGERCRLIPGCNHRFHVQCLDAWLAERSVCPICRTGVLQESGPSVVDLHAMARTNSVQRPGI